MFAPKGGIGRGYLAPKRMGVRICCWNGNTCTCTYHKHGNGYFRTPIYNYNDCPKFVWCFPQ